MVSAPGAFFMYAGGVRPGVDVSAACHHRPMDKVPQIGLAKAAMDRDWPDPGLDRTRLPRPPPEPQRAAAGVQGRGELRTAPAPTVPHPHRPPQASRPGRLHLHTGSPGHGSSG